MEEENALPIEKPIDNHRVARPTQTGFSSPATHYNEPRIDLNAVLVQNSEATFYIRVIDNASMEFGIGKNDVLIVDKSLTPKNNQLAVVISDGEFQINRIDGQISKELQIWGVITFIIKSVI